MISLEKGQSVSLEKSDGSSLTSVRMGLGWDAAEVIRKGLFGGSKPSRRNIDLDASVITFDASGNPVETVFFGNLKSRDGAIRHTGDNLTGVGDGDDESINVDLSRVDGRVQHLVFTINSYSGETFEEVANAECNLYDTSGTETRVLNYRLTETGRHTAMLMARVSRVGSGWSFTAIGAPASGRTAKQITDAARAAL